MKPFKSPGEQQRFRGPLRHYHRLNPNGQKTWDEWATGKTAHSKPTRSLWKIAAFAVATLGLAAIVAALIIELR